MGKNKDLIKAVLVLTILALISGALLGLFYQLTLITDEEKEERIILQLQKIDLGESLNVNYRKVDGFEPTDDIQYFFADEQAGVYAIVATGISGYKNKVPMYVIIKDDTIIALIEGSVSETPGISDAAFSDDYLKRFLKPISQFDFDEDIIATGATYSSRAVLSSIQNAVNFYKEYMLLNEPAVN